MRYLLHDVFLKSLAQTPDKKAIIMEGGRSVSYDGLNILANKFSGVIKGIKPSILEKPFVGIISTVHIESVAAVLGTLKIGGAYVPLDEFSPTERLNKIIDNTQLDIICIDTHLFAQHAALLENSHIKKVLLLNGDMDAEIPAHDKIVRFAEIEKASDVEPPLQNQVCDDLAYILHSSGSTGVPKGIMLTHRNARTFTDWMHKEFEITANDVIASRAPFKFDLSVFDIFNSFQAGATLICFDWNKKRPSETKHADYVQMLEQHNVSILYTTPSTFIALLNRGGLAEANTKLRSIMYAGEPFPPPQLKKVMEALPHTKVANIYGPTETNIITYYWVPEPPQNDDPIPLGGVVDDTDIIVVSEDGSHICAADELGELWCRGGTVTLGYLGMDDKTKECLVQSPFHPYPAYYWRTGDFGFRDAGGCLHYRGRRDHMVKVKGFRIELGEIEIALSAHQNIDEFVVVAVPDEKYGNRLYCHYAALKGKALNDNELKEFLLKKIPDYMVPYGFEKWETLPKTSSGKIDRVLLAQKSKNG
jgi:amino acid adenylation domain-containing protein